MIHFRSFLTILLISLIYLSCNSEAKKMANESDVTVYVGTYTTKGSDGIYVYKLNQQNGEMTLLHTVNDVENPSFLEISPDGRYLYSVHELNNYNGKRTGAVRSFAIDPSTRNLTLLSEQASNGEHPCHVSVTPAGSFVLLANYTSGSVSIFPAKEGILDAASDTAQHVGSGPNIGRQKGPHAHSINISPDGRFAFSPDLGSDKIINYKIDYNIGRLLPNSAQKFTATAPGAGPRHFTFHPNGRFAYVINELNSTITSFAYDPENGILTEIETYPTLPENFDGESTCADIHISPDGLFLYGSNRGHDSLVIFKIEASTGKLSLIGFEPTGGKTPRNFGIDPSGTFLLAANQNSDNIVIFRRDIKTGLLEKTGYEVQVSKPVCITFLIP